mmetsp:Transcript_10931/g.9650  ORF Transcript_10931/g.9650 Transcript_10931/m.9650 type:complete len:118 (+) Transcript_10931:662-1015(+)
MYLLQSNPLATSLNYFNFVNTTQIKAKNNSQRLSNRMSEERALNSNSKTFIGTIKKEFGEINKSSGIINNTPTARLTNIKHFGDISPTMNFRTRTTNHKFSSKLRKMKEFVKTHIRK